MSETETQDDAKAILIYHDILEMLQGFLPVYQAVVEDPEASEEELVNLAISKGLATMLTDLLGQELTTWQHTVEGLFVENPALVGQFIVQLLEKGIDKGLATEWKKSKEFYT